MVLWPATCCLWCHPERALRESTRATLAQDDKKDNTAGAEYLSTNLQLGIVATPDPVKTRAWRASSASMKRPSYGLLMTHSAPRRAHTAAASASVAASA